MSLALESIDDIPTLPTLVLKEDLNSIITTKRGRPDYLGINIYFDTLRSWYNPKKGYEKDGNIYYINKLNTKGVYLNYKKLSKIHGCSQEMIRKKLVKLEELGLIHRSFQHKGGSFNQLIVYVWSNTPHFFNPYGVDSNEIFKLIPQTNSEYVKKRYNVIFGSHAPQNKVMEVWGGIQPKFDTKELSNLKKDIDLEGSNFSENSKIQNLTYTQPKPPKRNKKCLSNQRKKPTNAEVKAKRVYRPSAYSEPKTLADMPPLLTSWIYDELRKRSGRDFPNSFIEDRVLAMSKDPKVIPRFNYLNGFIAYMSLALKYELHDAVKVSLGGFRLKTNLTEKDKIEAKIEPFLKKIEDDVIANNSPENKLKLSLASCFDRGKAYALLSRLKFFEIEEGIMKFYLTERLELTEEDKITVLSKVKYTYDTWRTTIEAVEYVIDEPKYVENIGNC